MASKRTVLITGCSDGGLGSQLALAFHKAGWCVFASARNMSKLKLVVAAGIETVQLDTLSDESIANCVARISELTGGSLDTLLNNAGGGYSMPMMDLDLDRTRQLFELNFFSVLSVTRAFLPLLLKSNRGGMIVNNTSGSSLPAGAMPFAGAYAASKAATSVGTEMLRMELAPFGIKVVNLVTGSVKSTFHANAPDAVLPPSSLYNVAKETVEKAMAGGEAAEAGADPVKWAETIVKGLEKSKPSHWIWAGTYATILRIANLLPIGMLDGTRKKMVGLDVLEREIRKQGGPSKIKH